MVYVVGKNVGLPERPLEWEFIGVYDTREAAEKECKDQNYFVGPVEMNFTAPHDVSIPWPGAYHPGGG